MATDTRESLRARREAVVNAHIEAEASKHDVAAALATVHHPRYEVPATGVIADGSEAVENFLRGVLGAYPDLWLKPLKIYHADDAVIVECVWGGTHLGPLPDLAPTGRAMRVESVLIFVFDDDRLICEKLYFDRATIRQQLGG